jgi:hypothetical protein
MRDFLWIAGGRPEKTKMLRAGAELLFDDLCKCVGGAEARRIFRELSKPPSKRIRSDAQNRLLLEMYEAMPAGKKSVRRLWNIIDRYNERSTKDERLGPRGPQTLATFERHMSRLLAKRR